MFDAKALSLALLGASGAFAKYIVPGGRWVDTEGNLVNAHAGNVVLDNGTFWWFGEYKIEGQEEGGWEGAGEEAHGGGVARRSVEGKQAPIITRHAGLVPASLVARTTTMARAYDDGPRN